MSPGKLLKLTQPLTIWLQRTQKHSFKGWKVRKSGKSGNRQRRRRGPRKSLKTKQMSSTHKKIIVQKLDRDSMNGYVVSSSFLVDGKLEMLNTAGVVVGIDLKDIKSVYFVRDFHETDLLARKTFTTRPRSAGLWVRLRFKDNEILEGTMPVDLTQSPAEGYLVNPPDLRSNTQKIFVPRTALASFTVLAVVGAVKRKRRTAAGELQEKLFEEQ